MHDSYMHVLQQVLFINFRALIPIRLHNRTELGCGLAVNTLPYLAVSQKIKELFNFHIKHI